MSLPELTPGESAATAAPRRTWMAVKRGLRGLCPACGQGRILHAYLKVNPSCPSCGEELHHQRADDFPPYITIFVVGHIVGAAMFAVSDIWPDLSVGVQILVWPAVCVLLSLWLLPIFKGALIAYQWALRMHGFETAHLPAEPVVGSLSVGHRAAA